MADDSQSLDDWAPVTPAAAPRTAAADDDWAPVAQPAAAAPPARPADEGPHPGLLGTAGSATLRGIIEGGKEVGHAASPFAERPEEAPDNSYVGKLLQTPISEGWSTPNWWAAQIGHGLGHSAPSLAAGLAGGAAGTAAFGPVGGLVGSAGGFGIGSMVQELPAAYDRAIKDGLDHDAAVNRALVDTGVAGAFGTVMGLAPGVSLFGKTVGTDATGAAVEALKQPVSEALAQIFGVQPAIGAAQQVVGGMVDGRPATAEEIAQGYAMNVGMGAGFVGAHKGVERLRRGKGDDQGPPADQAAAADDWQPVGPPPPADRIGLSFPGQPPRGATVEQYWGDQNQYVRVRFDDGTPADYLASDVMRTQTEVPPIDPAANAAPMPGQPVSEAERYRDWLESQYASEPTPSARPQSTPILGSDAIRAIEQADALERRAMNDPNRTAEQRADDYAAAQELRRKFGHAGGEPVTGEQAPEAAAQAADARERARLGDLGQTARPAGEPGGGPWWPQTSPTAPPPDSLMAAAPREPAPLALRRPVDLAEFLASEGGIKDETGELRAMDADKWHRQKPFRKKLVNPEGLSYGEARERAQEMGYLPPDPENGPATSDNDALFEALRENLSGRHVFSSRDDSMANAWEESRREHQPFVDGLKQRASDIGIDVPEGWGPEDILAAVHEREAIEAEGDGISIAWDRNNDEYDHVLAAMHPELFDVQRQEGISADRIGNAGDQPAQAATRPAGGEPAGEDAGREAPPPGAGPGGEGERPPGGEGVGPREFRQAVAQNRAGEAAAPVRAERGAPFERPADAGKRTAPVKIETPADMEAVRQRVDRDPSAAQVKAGNATKGYADFQGLPIAIETVKGGVREDKQNTPPKWRVENFPADYGDIRRTEGADKDPVDAFIGPNPRSDRVFVIDQVNPETGRFDEHKAMLGYDGPGDALSDYGRAHTDGRSVDRVGGFHAITMDQFKDWLANGETKKPFALQGGEQEALPAAKKSPSIDQGTGQEPDHGLQNAVSAGDEGARPGPVYGAPANEPARPAPAAEVGASPRDAGRVDRERTESGERPAEGPGGAGEGGGDRAGDTDRLPAEAGPGESGAAGRPAPDAEVAGKNFTIEPGAVEEGRSPRTKALDNVAAIELAKRIIAEDRPATREEQAVLAKYVGWGGLSGAFENSEGRLGKGLEGVGARLKELLSPEEHATAKRSTQYAHYTADHVIRSMWRAVDGMGFKGGMVFEPGMGVGHFLGMMPPDLAGRSTYQGIEFDHLTASIAKLLYPESGVRHADYTRTPMPENTFDLVIGNPPFSDTVIKSDPKYSARGFMLHDYFFAKSLDSVRPGGLLGFVTSAGTMNKTDPSARQYIADRADFVGGVRLPSSAFKRNAGTEVTTDILFFKKRAEGAAPGSTDWTETVPRTFAGRDGQPMEVNVSRYFAEHPGQILGEEGLNNTQYATERYGVEPRPGQDLEAELRAAMDRLPKDVMEHLPTPQDRAEIDFASGQKKDGSFYLQDGKLMQYRDGAGRPVERRGAGVTGGMSAPEMERVQAMVPVRDALRDVFRHDLAENAEESAKARETLNQHYDRFVRKYGPINKAEYQYRRPNIIQQETARAEAREAARERGEYFDEGEFDPRPLIERKAKTQEIARARKDAMEAAEREGRKFDHGSFDPDDMPDIVIEKRPNIDPFGDDPESYRLRSIEYYDDATGKATKKRVFTENILTHEREPAINSAQDGVLWSLNKHGRLDLGAIAEKMGRDRQDVINELGDSIFKVPGTDDTYHTASEYLSGDVVDKLQEARAHAPSDPDVRRNVAALEAAQPVPLAPSEISMNLGMPWIPPETIAEFARDRLQIGEPRVAYSEAIGQWVVDPSRTLRGDGVAEWGTNDRNAFDLLADALNRTPPRIYRTEREPGGGTTRVFDPIATQAAQDKYDAMRSAFDDWTKGDPDRAEKLSALYNDKLNRVVLRQYDGDYLTTPGVSADWAWRPHQKRVVSRIIQSGSTYMAHAVGAGKAQPLDAKILTPSGWVRMGDLAAGDTVIAGDGTATTVTGVFPQGEKEIFRVTFSDGAHTECCEEHLWLTQNYAERTGAGAATKLGKVWAFARPKVRSLADIRATLTGRLGAKNHAIPIVGAAAFPSAPVPLDPYLLGVLLGDGCLRQEGATISSADEDIVRGLVLPANIELRLVNATRPGCPTWSLRMIKHSGFGANRVPNPVVATLAQMGLLGSMSATKFVPPSYLWNDAATRLAVLQGLLDTDGSVSGRGHSVYFYSVSDRLADDVVFLVRSLGGIVRRSIKTPNYRHNGERRVGQPCHVLCLRLPPDVVPFRLKRKADLVKPKTKYLPVRYIVSAERVGKKQAQCIAVAHSSRLYVTDDFVVTHNTSAMIGAGMEMRRLGLVRKPMYVVPNHMLGQFAKEFYEQYPTARIAIADERRFHTDRRKQFVANVSQDDLDAIIITHSGFGKIPISDEFQQHLINEQIDSIDEALGQLDKADDRITVKRLEKQKEKLEQKLSARGAGRQDQTNTFEEMGVDFAFIDEAHQFRKLSFATKQSGLKGITPDGSDAAWDLYTKLRYLESKNPGRSAVLASGTPVTNTMGELYTISRYLQPEELEKRGLAHFDSWASTFGDVKNELEQTADGNYAPVTRFSRFVNIPELYKMVGGIMDVVTPSQLEKYVVRPKLQGGERQFHLAPLTETLADYQKTLAKRMEDIKNRKGPPQKGDDILLSVINDGRHAAIDPRFVTGSQGANDPNSKLNMMIDNVHRIWKESKSQQFYDPKTNYEKPLMKGPAAQMIFANLGIGESGARDFSGYQWMKNDLIRRGVPANEIAFIKDYKSHIARQKLFNDVNEGKVRILIGSTQKMGTGVNAQRRLIALHNQDPLWFPADDEQRVGRALRQGNLNPEIQIHDYSTKGTYDSTMWQMMGRKGRFIEQFFRGDPELRDMEDLGEASMYEQASAMATSDERLIQLTDLRQQLDKANRRFQAHEREQYGLKQRATNAAATIAHHTKRIPEIEQDIAQRRDTRGDKFNMEVSGKPFTTRKDAAVALSAEHAKTFPGLSRGKEAEIGSIGGFPLLVGKDMRDNPYYGIRRANGEFDELRAEGHSASGVIQSAEHRIANLESEVNYHRNQMADAQRNLELIKPQIGKPFEGYDEIDRLDRAVRDLEQQLKPPEKPKELPVGEAPDEEAAQQATRGTSRAPTADEREVVPGVLGRLKPSGEFNRVQREAGAAVDAIAAKMFPAAKVQAIEGMRPKRPTSEGQETHGAFHTDPESLAHIMSWALDSPDHEATVRHEGIHYLRRSGLIDEGEWGALAKGAAAEDWVGHYDIANRYPNLDADGRLEEAIADRFAMWRREQGGVLSSLPEWLKPLFYKLDLFRRRVAAVARLLLGKDATADDVFARVESGEVGRRAFESDPGDWEAVPSGAAAEQRPTIDQTSEGPQPVIPGAERVTPEELAAKKATDDKARAEIAMRGRQRGAQPQQAADQLPLFGGKGEQGTLFQRGAANPERPEIVPGGHDPLDNVSDAMAETLGGRNIGTYARRAAGMLPSSRGALPTKFLGAVEKFVILPRTLASADWRSARYWDENRRRDATANALRHDWSEKSAGYVALKPDQRAKLHAVEELDRLNNLTRQNDGRQIVARNDGQAEAEHSKPGEAIALDPATSAVYHERRGLFRDVWRALTAGAAKKLGWDGAVDPAAIRAEAERPMLAAGEAKRLRSIADLVESMQAQERAGYVPLMRFGDYYIAVKPKEGTAPDSLGGFPETTRFELVDSRGAFDKLFGKTDNGAVPKPAAARIKELQAKYGKDFTIEHGYLARHADALRKLDIPAVEKLFIALQQKDSDLYGPMVEKLRDQMYEEMKAGFKRRSRTVPGYSSDFQRATGAYLGWTSGHTADMLHRDAIRQAQESYIEPHPDQGVRQYWQKWADYQNSPKSEMQALRQFGFFWTLAANPSSTALIATHGPMVAHATLGAGVGYGAAGRHLYGALGEAVRALRVDGTHGIHVDVSKVGRTPAEKALVADAIKSGQVHAAAADDIRGLAQGQSELMGEHQKKWQRMLDIASSNISAADQVNRVGTLLGAYRLFSQPGMLEKAAKTWEGNQVFRTMVARDGLTPTTMARFMVDEGLFVWGKTNRAPVQRGAAGTMLFQFRNFETNYLSSLWKMMHRMGPEGKGAALMMMAGLGMLGGALSLPFAQDAENAYDAAHKILTGIDPQAEAKIYQLMEDVGFSKLGAEAMLRGPARSLLGIDLSSRLGFGETASRNLTPTAALGVVPSMLYQRLSAAWNRHESGQDTAAVADLLPTAARNLVRGTEVYPTEGVKTQYGNTVVPREKITGTEQTAQALGFEPATVARAYEEHGYLQRTAKATRELHSRLVAQATTIEDQMTDARRRGDDGDATRLGRELGELLAAHPDVKVTAEAIKRQVVARQNPNAAAMKRASLGQREAMGRSPFVAP